MAIFIFFILYFFIIAPALIKFFEYFQNEYNGGKGENQNQVYNGKLLIISSILFAVLLWSMLPIGIELKVALCIFCGIVFFTFQPVLAMYFYERNYSMSKAKASFVSIILILIIPITMNLLYLAKYQTAIKSIPQDGNIELKVESSKKLMYNNNVGNSWVYEVIINGKTLSSDGTILVNVQNDGKLYISSRVTESDIINDVGIGNVNIEMKDFNMADKNMVIIPVRVEETRGRYAGNAAAWEITLTIKRNLGFWYTVFN